jgi:hypothetical protein
MRIDFFKIYDECKGDCRMRTIAKNLPLVLAAALLIQNAHTQAAPKPDAAPKPPDSPSKVLLDNWNDVGRKLIAIAEDFPEDKYDFKPNPASGLLSNSFCTRP